MKKSLIIGIVIVLVVLGGFFLIGKDQVTQAPVSNEMPVLGEEGEGVPEMIVTEEPMQPPSPQTATVTYTDSGFSPNELHIKSGGTVVFKNMSSGSMWPASAMHPTHNVYQQHTGMCALIGGSNFDACGPIAPGVSWSFQFNSVGSWAYHDHTSPNFFGKIIVEE